MQICISENTHYWEYALLYPRQFRVMTQTESASWSITASKYTIFSWIPIILIFLQGLWTLTLITEVSHWELKLRKILPRIQLMGFLVQQKLSLTVRQKTKKELFPEGNVHISGNNYFYTGMLNGPFIRMWNSETQGSFLVACYIYLE